jgi:outer membrane protein
MADKNNQHVRDTSIAIVDLKKVASTSMAGNGIDKQITEINNASKKDLIELESKIKSMESNKSQDVDQRKIEDMQLILYDMVSTKKEQISTAYKNAILALEQEINKVIETIAKQEGIRIVLTADAVIYSSNDCIDITQKVIEEVNKNCKEIKVTLKQ